MCFLSFVLYTWCYCRCEYTAVKETDTNLWPHGASIQIKLVKYIASDGDKCYREREADKGAGNLAGCWGTSCTFNLVLEENLAGQREQFMPLTGSSEQQGVRQEAISELYLQGLEALYLFGLQSEWDRKPVEIEWHELIYVLTWIMLAAKSIIDLVGKGVQWEAVRPGRGLIL